MAKKRTWFWIVGAIIIIATALVCVLTTDRYPNKWMQLYIVISILAFWLVSIAGYALYLSSQSEEKFINLFCKTFHSNWSYFIIFVLIMFSINCLWSILHIHIYNYNKPDLLYITFKQERWTDIKQTVLFAPFWEELPFRVLPFLITSVLLFIVKKRNWRIVLIIVLGLMIFGIQMYFGAKHFNPDYAEITGDSLMEHIMLQGGGGVIFATTYGVVLYNAYQILTQRCKKRNWIVTLLYANLFGYLASFSVHSLYNLYCVLISTF